MQTVYIQPEQFKKIAKRARQEPQFVGFACIACGQRHADLKTLIECAETKRAAHVRSK